MEANVKHMLAQQNWAVIGATTNQAKFGNIIFKRLTSAGYKVYPVNPVYNEIEGVTCYGSLNALPEKPDCLNVVVAPEKALGFIDEAAALGIPYVWFQPGSYTQETLAYAQSKGLKVVADYCVLVELSGRGK